MFMFCHRPLFFVGLLLGCSLMFSSPLTIQAEESRSVPLDESLTLQIPAGWEQVKPENNLRLAQFSLPKADGDDDATELAVFPPFGGTVNDNLTRWVGQFTSPVVKSTKGKTAKGDYYFLDLTGTYQKSDGPPILRKTIDKPGYRMLAVILKVGEANYFLKLTGPEKSVAAQADAFRKSFGGAEDSESAYEMK